MVVVDVETTGLDPTLHWAYEAAWWTLGVDEAPNVIRLPHTLDHADPRALQVGDYWGRGFLPIADAATYRLRKALVDVTLVGANPAFDAGFLRRALGCQTWHHRMVDVEVMAWTLFGWDELKGLRELAAHLRGDGWDIPEPDHTAAGDVLTTRAVFYALMELREARL